MNARRCLTLAAWLGLLTAALAVLLKVGAGLPEPPREHGASPWAWLETADPVALTFAAIRLAGIALDAYLLMTTVVGVLTRLSGRPRLTALTDAITHPLLRRFLQRTVMPRVVATSLATSVALIGPASTLVTTTGTATAQPNQPTAANTLPPDEVAGTEEPPPVMSVLDRLAADEVAGTEEPPPVMSVLEPAGPPEPIEQTGEPPDDRTPPRLRLESTAHIDATPTSQPAPPAVAEPPAASGADPRATSQPTEPADGEPTRTIVGAPAGMGSNPQGTTLPTSPPVAAETSTANQADPHGTTPPEPPASMWTIAPGEHLWHVSATTLERAWSRQPTNAEIANYLNQLIRLNADRFVIPGNPDLVYPGQVFMLPPLGP